MAKVGVKEGPSRRENFVRLANNRVNRAIRDIRLIGNLSNKQSYSYGEDDVKKILRALLREVEAVRTRFSGSGSGRDAEFSLDD